jgi:hypothetical protein
MAFLPWMRVDFFLSLDPHFALFVKGVQPATRNFSSENLGRIRVTIWVLELVNGNVSGIPNKNNSNLLYNC